MSSAVLIEEHRLIQSAADAFVGALRQTPRAPQEIPRLRAELAGRIMRHRVTEEDLIHRPFAAAGGFDELPEVMSHIHKIREEWLAYSKHVRNWTPIAMEADWKGYVGAVERRVDILRQLTVFEEREVYAPVLRFLEQVATARKAGEPGVRRGLTP